MLLLLLLLQNFPTISGRPTLMDRYEYVMHGKIFKFKDNQGGGDRVEVYISFGGLLMQLIGGAKELADLQVDNNVFLLIRRV